MALTWQCGPGSSLGSPAPGLGARPLGHPRLLQLGRERAEPPTVAAAWPRPRSGWQDPRRAECSSSWRLDILGGRGHGTWVAARLPGSSPGLPASELGARPSGRLRLLRLGFDHAVAGTTGAPLPASLSSEFLLGCLV